MAIGKSIEQLIKNSNMSLKEFSEESGISYNTLYAIIKRDNDTIKPEILKKISKTLHVQLTDLFEIGEEVNYFNPGDGTQSTLKKKNDAGKMEEHIHVGGATFSQTSSSLTDTESRLLSYYRQLSSLGKQEAIKRIEELSLLPNYSDKKPPTSE